jgi:NADH:ubiquinone oxidoreductase subunit E
MVSTVSQYAQIVREAIEEYGATKDAIIPILSLINKAYGYIPGEAFKEIREQLLASENHVSVSESQIYSIEGNTWSVSARAPHAM